MNISREYTHKKIDKLWTKQCMVQNFRSKRHLYIVGDEKGEE
jgi:hypothetical protein